SRNALRAIANVRRRFFPNEFESRMAEAADVGSGILAWFCCVASEGNWLMVTAPAHERTNYKNSRKQSPTNNACGAGKFAAGRLAKIKIHHSAFARQRDKQG